jgi:anti-sigma B factor antagonist
MSFTVNVRREGAVVTVAVSGEVDLATAPVLDREIKTAITSSDVAEVIVDLSEVGFLDSSGIKALVEGRKLADSYDVLFSASGAQGLVRQVLDLAGLWEHLSRQR